MRGRSVLVVDDNPNFIELVKYNLIKENIPVQVRRSQHHDAKDFKLNDVGLVVSDFYLPGSNGLNLFKQIKLDPKVENPLFILLAEEFDQLDFREALSLGVNDFYIKPIKVRQLIKSIKILMGMSTQKHGSELCTDTINLVERVQVDNNSYEIFIEETAVSFNQVEFQLFKLFIYNPGKVFTFGQLYLEMNAFGFFLSIHSIQFQIELLKRKLRQFKIQFTNIQDVGFMLETI